MIKLERVAPHNSTSVLPALSHGKPWLPGAVVARLLVSGPDEARRRCQGSTRLIPEWKLDVDTMAAEEAKRNGSTDNQL